MSEESQAEVTVEELLLSQVYMVQAMINVLEKKGLLKREEVFQEFNEIQHSSCDCGHDHSHG